MAMRRQKTSDEGGVDKESNLTGSIRSMVMRARTRTRQKWLEFQPENEQIMVNCDECRTKLRELTWISDDTHGFGYLEPIFEECEVHSQLFTNWVADLTTALNQLHQQR